eukprot:754256-Hanusia_phi.AAC.2
MVVKVPSLWQAGKSPSLNDTNLSSLSARLPQKAQLAAESAAPASLTQRSAYRADKEEVKDISLSGLGSLQVRSWNERLGETILEFDEYEERVKREIDRRSNIQVDPSQNKLSERSERDSMNWRPETVVGINESFVEPSTQISTPSQRIHASPPLDDQLPCQYVSLTPRKLRVQPMLCLPLEVSSKTVSSFFHSKHSTEKPRKLGSSQPREIQSWEWKIDKLDTTAPENTQDEEQEEYKLVIEQKLLSFDVSSADRAVGDDCQPVESPQEVNSSSSSGGSSIESSPRVASERISNVKDFMRSDYRKWAADWNPGMKAAWEGSAKRLEMLQRDEIVLLHHLEGDLNEKTFTCSSISADIFSAPSPFLAENPRESYLIDETLLEDDSHCFLEQRRHFIPVNKSSSYESSSDLSRTRSPPTTAPVENLAKEREEELARSFQILPANSSFDSPRRLDGSWIKSSALPDSTKTPPRYGAPRYVFGNTDRRATSASSYSYSGMVSVSPPLLCISPDARAAGSPQTIEPRQRQARGGGKQGAGESDCTV